MGRPKALIRIENTTLIERTVQIVRSMTDDIFLLGQPRFELPASVAAWPLIPDHHPGIGPIGGLESLLNERPHDKCLLIACDMPRLNRDILQRLADATGNIDAAICRSRPPNDINVLRWHPCCGLYSPSARSSVITAVETGQYRMTALIKKLHVQPIDLTANEISAVENWNSPGDLPS